MYGLKLVTAPAVEPVSLAEAKTHCRVTATDDDAYLTALITVCRKYLEDVCNRSFITQTWDYYLDTFPPYVMLLPRGPLQTVGYVKYTDTAGVLQTLDPAQYVTDNKQEPGRVQPSYNIHQWPVVQPEALSGVQVRFDAGFGAAVDVPDEIKQAIKLMIGHLYENREDTITGTIIASIPLGLSMLIQSQRVVNP